MGGIDTGALGRTPFRELIEGVAVDLAKGNPLLDRGDCPVVYLYQLWRLGLLPMSELWKMPARIVNDLLYLLVRIGELEGEDGGTGREDMGSNI